jgi:putative DNA primase/helicase
MSPNIRGDLNTLDLVGVFRDLGFECTAKESGKYHVECPWEHEHGKTGKTDTVIWQDGTNWPTFLCSHNHCADRNTEIVIEWAESQQAGIIDRHCARDWSTGDYNPQRPRDAKSEPPKAKFAHKGDREDIPEGELSMSLYEYFTSVLKFQDDELVRFARYDEIKGGEHDGKLEFVTGQKDWAVSDLAISEAELREKLGELGSFYAINPYKPDAQDRKTESVSRFLYLLLEHDSLPKEEQLAIYRKSRLPIAALSDSGDKSIHALVRINAPNRTEYERRRDVMMGYFQGLGFDKTQDAARFSRLPNAPRVYELPDGGYAPSRQRLLEVNIGFATWEEWEASIAPKDDYTDQINAALFSVDQMRELVIPPNKPVSGDWFLEADIGFIFSPRGAGKTWFAMEMARCVSENQPFGPYQAHGAFKALYIDGEVAARAGQQRLMALNARGHNFAYLNHELLFKHSHITMDLADPKWQKSILTLCDDYGFRIIFIDNLSCLAPNTDENDSIAWSSQLLNFALNIRRRGMSLVLVQHAGRNGNMRGHSRREDPANWIIKLTRIEEEVGAKFRAVFEKNRNAAHWPAGQEWHFRPDGARTLVTCRLADNMTVFLDLVEDGVEVNKMIAEAMEVSEATVTRLAQRAENDGYIKRERGKYKFMCR